MHTNAYFNSFLKKKHLLLFVIIDNSNLQRYNIVTLYIWFILITKKLEGKRWGGTTFGGSSLPLAYFLKLPLFLAVISWLYLLLGRSVPAVVHSSVFFRKSLRRLLHGVNGVLFASSPPLWLRAQHNSRTIDRLSKFPTATYRVVIARNDRFRHPTCETGP